MIVATQSSRTADARASIPRACGALALNDVMSDWGVEANLAKTWACVASADPFGTMSAKSYRLAGYAMANGLRATTLKCRNDRAWDSIKKCEQLGLSVIINHQASAARHEGHFSILISISNQSIVTHDPILRAQVEWSRDEFLSHWTPNEEIAGHVLVAIGGMLSETFKTSANRCPSCNASLYFEPSELFEASDWRLNGLWRYFYCPGCDASFGSSPQIDAQ